MKRHFKKEIRLLNKTSFWTLTFAVISLAGCAAKDAKPSNGMDQIESAGAPGRGVSSTPAVTAPTDIGGSMVAPSQANASSTTPGDTSKAPKVEVPHVAGRSKKDSIALVMAIRAGMKDTRWPVKAVPVLPGSILPARRIVAFYGNPLSKKMGVLGELPPQDMLKKFDKEIDAWRKADPATPVQPALHLIAVVAQGYPGRDGKYRLRMTDNVDGDEASVGHRDAIAIDVEDFAGVNAVRVQRFCILHACSCDSRRRVSPP